MLVMVVDPWLFFWECPFTSCKKKSSVFASRAMCRVGMFPQLTKREEPNYWRKKTAKSNGNEYGMLLVFEFHKCNSKEAVWKVFFRQLIVWNHLKQIDRQITRKNWRIGYICKTTHVVCKLFWTQREMW